MSNPASLKPFKKGHDPRRNVNGANKGHNNFETDFNVAVETIAEQNKITFSEARQRLLLVGYKEAGKGNYQFWQYIHNQIYGTAKETKDIFLEVTSSVADLDNDKLENLAKGG